MMKKIILMSIAAMILTSCAKDSMKEANKGRAIDFRVAAQSRATETTTANLTTFYVTAIDEQGSNYFTNAAFTKIEEYFSSSPVYYWPGSGSLNFFAYAPSATTLGATVTINNTTKTLAGFSPAAEISDQKDFVTASASGSKADETSGVALTFDHQLSQIEVKARNANEGYVYQIKGVRFAQPVAKADFDFATSEWTLSTDAADKAVYDVTYNNVVTLNTFAQNIMRAEGDNAMLLPQQLVAWNPETDPTNANKGAYISVYAQIKTADGAKVYPKTEEEDAYAWLAVPIDTKWEAGHKYVYTLDFTEGAGYSDPLDGSTYPVLGKAIKLIMSVNPWNEKSTEDPIIGTWQIVKSDYTIWANGEVISHEISESPKELNENVPTPYTKLRWFSPFEFYDGDEEYLISYFKDGRRYVFEDEESGNYIYFDWLDEDCTTLRLTIWETSEYQTDDWYMYYKKI